jgi:hypothetical protein
MAAENLYIFFKLYIVEEDFGVDMVDYSNLNTKKLIEMQTLAKKRAAEMEEEEEKKKKKKRKKKNRKKRAKQKLKNFKVLTKFFSFMYQLASIIIESRQCTILYIQNG